MHSVVVFATRYEAGPFLRRHRAICRADRVWALEKAGTPSELSVAVLGAGSGQIAARSEHLVETLAPDLVISAGFSGALVSTLRPGTVVLGADTSSGPAPVRDRIAAKLAAPVVRSVSAPRIVEHDHDRVNLRAITGASIVDIESSAVRDVCRARGIECVELRVISDTGADDLPVPARHMWDAERGHPRLARLAAYLITHPHRVGPFLGMTRVWNQARLSLAGALEKSLPLLS